tara:strand:- start:2072 stop:2182 length:111 start_codon:yes stop_codon:yes gene_type:complete
MGKRLGNRSYEKIADDLNVLTKVGDYTAAWCETTVQ